MNSLLLAASLFRDRAGRLDFMMVLEAVAVLIVGALGAWWATNAWKRRSLERPHRHPQKLFAALCRAHRLDRNERRLVAQLADFHRLAQPGLLFLAPECFDLAKLGSFAGNLNEVQSLDERLFGSR